MEWTKSNFGYGLELQHGNAFVSPCAVSGKWEWSANKNDIDDTAHVYGFCYDVDDAMTYAEAFLGAVQALKIRQTLPVIDWENAPDDAVCHANWCNGQGFFYCNIPRLDEYTWTGTICCAGVDMEAPGDGAWEQSLQMRPGTEG